ncbi:hypothetical protein HK099_008589 [Clydaea vesicula]|uniref:Amino acid transporter transmembrane domain-containing protein n=1 Tax=Clydaea vesicula TaxID=447962 RepID=A0AAD5U4M4_9FUNG|nr:hypothetical protein HK099_008589 [Clydaea vesicula]
MSSLLNHEPTARSQPSTHGPSISVNSFAANNRHLSNSQLNSFSSNRAIRIPSRNSLHSNNSLRDWASSYSRSVLFGSQKLSVSQILTHLNEVNQNQLNAEQDNIEIDPDHDNIAQESFLNMILSQQRSHFQRQQEDTEVRMDAENKDFFHTHYENLSNFDESTEETALLSNEIMAVEKSSFFQSVFNSVNVLMGIGILSLPFAFKLTGWALGFTLLFFFALITRYTATVLASCMDHKSASILGITVFTYSDMGELAFGHKGRLFISVIFLLELFTACVALLILMADSIKALYPTLDINFIKIVVTLIVMPSTWPRSLKVLAYGSIIGIIALINLISIIIYDGTVKLDKPGSLVSPMDTNMFPTNLFNIPFAFGLIMSGFGGHSVFPQIYRDMAQPKRYPSMVNITYIATAILYLLVGVIGYLMFGNGILKEITLNLSSPDLNYNEVLTKLTIWLIAINPATKYALTINPITINFEILLYKKNKYFEQYSSFVRMAFSTIITCLVLIISIIVPGFHQMMAFLGSFFAFVVSVIFPCLCNLKLNGGCFIEFEKNSDLHLFNDDVEKPKFEVKMGTLEIWWYFLENFPLFL